ncbi:hypothetical protein KY290_026114 [Solanum tuberosum]|uniref:Retrotransposon gag domain-containing protein n=1 Tax=Solanum tuberosum TaxID=4113 RepID=A0ABQ7UX64_SOLTU|nr:hypothetical protein KY290_026114 [Solanum tuberosum]
MSISSLHQFIAACSINLKPTNYLIWRSQISQLIHVMRLTYLITKNEQSKSSCSTGQTIGKVVVELDLRHLDRRNHVPNYGLLNCQGGECLEEAYLQATKDKKFKLKQHLQNVRLGTKKIDEYIKKFKGICDGLTAIHKPVDEDNKGKLRGGATTKPHGILWPKGQGRGNNNINSRETGFKPAEQGRGS